MSTIESDGDSAQVKPVESHPSIIICSQFNRVCPSLHSLSDKRLRNRVHAASINGRIRSVISSRVRRIRGEWNFDFHFVSLFQLRFILICFPLRSRVFPYFLRELLGGNFENCPYYCPILQIELAFPLGSYRKNTRGSFCYFSNERRRAQSCLLALRFIVRLWRLQYRKCFSNCLQFSTPFLLSCVKFLARTILLISGRRS